MQAHHGICGNYHHRWMSTLILAESYVWEQFVPRILADPGKSFPQSGKRQTSTSTRLHMFYPRPNGSHLLRTFTMPDFLHLRVSLNTDWFFKSPETGVWPAVTDTGSGKKLPFIANERLGQRAERAAVFLTRSEFHEKGQKGALLGPQKYAGSDVSKASLGTDFYKWQARQCYSAFPVQGTRLWSRAPSCGGVTRKEKEQAVLFRQLSQIPNTESFITEPQYSWANSKRHVTPFSSKVLVLMNALTGLSVLRPVRVTVKYSKLSGQGARLVHNSPKCLGAVYSCYRSISLFFSNQEEIRIYGHEIKMNGISLSLPQTVGQVYIEKLADYILVKTTFGFSLAWDGISGVYLKLSEEHRGKSCGLCANYNGIQSDDFMIQEEDYTEDIATFANSWMVQTLDDPKCIPTPSDFPNPCSSGMPAFEAIFFKCQILLQFPFLSCHEYIDPYLYIASCVNDLCKTDDDETYCRAATEYARACSHAGFPIQDWRDDFPACIDKCDDSFVHRDCISCCPPSCTFEKQCLGSNLHCLDGCYCADVQCSVVGDSHFTTFDGRHYSFIGLCQYILVKGTGKDKFTITLQKAHCEQNLGLVCLQSITLILEDDFNKQVTLSRGGQILTSPNHGFTLNGVVEIQTLSSLFILLRTNFGLKILFAIDGERIYIQLSSAWKRRTLGLCGTFNGNIRDDFLSPSGMIEGTPQLHAHAWRVSSTCFAPVHVPMVDPCNINQQNIGYAAHCDIIHQELFAPCHVYVSPGLYYQLCRHDACKCGSSCLCNALAHYAYLCAQRDHRSPSVVSMIAQEDDQCNDDCAEGCNCPEGKFYEDTLNFCVPIQCSNGTVKCDEPATPSTEWRSTRESAMFLRAVLASGRTGSMSLGKSSPHHATPVCTVYGDRHYYSFDGLEYDYISDCQVFLIKSTDDSDISVIAQNKKCFDNNIVCSKSVLISIGNTEIYLNEAPYKQNKLAGLCGNFDKCTSNDMTTSNNLEVRNAQVFGDSWALGQCEDPVEALKPCEAHQNKFPYAKKECSILYSDVFAPCRNVIDVTSFAKNCHEDTCNCNLGGDCECLCTSVAAYAYKCCQEGVPVRWRSPTVCALALVSLESAERPNYFLYVHDNGTLSLLMWQASSAFHQRATFFHHQGLWIPGASAFELYSKKGFFIVFTDSSVRVSKYDDSEEFKESSSFSIEEIQAVVPYRRMCEWRYEPCATPCFKTCSDPEALACAFLPPVEGCLPHCPKYMILDEVTLKCVYPEDCIPLIPTEPALEPPDEDMVTPSDVTPTTGLECEPQQFDPVYNCSQYICLNMEWTFYNWSLNCPKDLEMPDCGFRGWPVQVNSDICCPEWECPCRCSMLSELSIITFDGNSAALSSKASYVLVRIPGEIVVVHIEKCSMNQVDVDSIVVPLPFSSQELFIEDSGTMYVITTPAGLVIKWAHLTGIIDIHFGPQFNLSSYTEGLCGICNDDPDDDLRMQNGTIITNMEDIELFIGSWEIEKSFEVTMRRPVRNCTEHDCSHCIELLNRDVFIPCHDKVSPWDFCEKMWINYTYLWSYECDAISAYAALCNKFDICIRWRTPDYCLCTDREDQPRSAGEIWNGGVDECALYKCLEDGSIIPIEPICEEEPSPICEREAEVVMRIVDKLTCCSKEVCGCDMTLCDTTIPICTGSQKLMVGYSALSCCPQYECECDTVKCPNISTPDCREDQFTLQVQQGEPCCFYPFCVCEACTEPAPQCADGEFLTVDLNTTHLCCPQYSCECNCENLVMPTCEVLPRWDVDLRALDCLQRADERISGLQASFPPNCPLESQNQTHSEGSSWRYNCTMYECVRTDEGATILNYSMNEGIVKLYNEGCCKICKWGWSPCRSRVVFIAYVVVGVSEQSVPKLYLVSVASCDGKCPSATIYNINVESHLRFCKCCRENGVRNITVPLHCSGNGTEVMYTLQEPVDCTCQWN
ncbi:hypothetical protein ACRRTK_012231 [Alexandromys fortis]